MKALEPVPVDPFLPTGRRRRGVADWAAGNAIGSVLVLCGIGLVVSASVDLLTGPDDVGVLAGLGVLSVVAGLALRMVFPMPDRVLPRAALNAVVLAALGAIAVSSAVYLATGTLDRLDDALFESTAGFTTTALTAIPDREALPSGMLFWRATTQWVGGFGALVTIVAVLPFLGVGGPRTAEAKAPLGVRHLLSAHTVRLLRDYGALYIALTAAGAVLFFVGGMGLFDAVTYAFTTISTGGFANHDRSFAHFDSAVIEWMGIVGMFTGGMSLALLWRVLRGKTGSLLQSAELVAYTGLVVSSTVIVALTADSGEGVHDTVRTSLFSVVSVISTTGHWVVDWTVWDPGAQMLLLVLMGVGAMSGSMGGGFRIVRALTLFSFIGRELARQLQPRTVRVIRVGRAVVDEELVDRMIGYQVLFLGAAGFGLLVLALTGADFVTALSGSVSALSTVGPALGDLAPGTSLAAADRGVLLVLMVGMFAGRVELYPVLELVASVLAWPARLVRTRRRRRQRQWTRS